MEKGQIAILKTTGERIYLITETDRRTWQVRRPSVGEFGVYEHTVEEFFSGEICTPEEYTDMMIDEMILKAKKQKRLIKAENELRAEQFAAAEDPTTDEDPIN